MKINELFFWVLLIAYDDLCRDYVLSQANEEVETVFYRKMVEAFFLFQDPFVKKKLIASIIGGHPILKKVTNDREMFLGLEVKNQELMGE